MFADEVGKPELLDVVETGTDSGVQGFDLGSGHRCGLQLSTHLPWVVVVGRLTLVEAFRAGCVPWVSDL